MRETTEVVKSADGGQWEFKMTLPETIDEACEIYGKDGALDIFNSGLKVKKQNIAREGFKNGKDIDEVESLCEAYRPGEKKKNQGEIFTELVMENAEQLRMDPDLKKEILDLYKTGKVKDAIDRLRTLSED